MPSTASMPTGPGGVMQWGLECDLLDERRVVALAVCPAAWMPDLARVLTSIYTLEMGSRKMAVATSGAWALDLACEPYRT